MAALDMDRLRAHARRFADGFTPGQKTITVLGVVAVVLAGYSFMTWASSTEYAALYTGLEGEDAGEITQELDARGIPYKLADGGRTIMVPRSDVYETRVDLSAEGLPNGGRDGFPLLDKGGITKSEFSQRVDYQRALQGEIARTVEAIDGVGAARVMLTIPRDDVFVGAEEEQATASVLVEPTGGKELDAETVQAIVHIVSSSVADMTADDVTVADSLGNVLAAPGKNGTMAAGENFERQAAFESALAASVERFIATSLGPGRAAVTVSADLDFSVSNTNTTRFEQPGGIQVPQSSRTETETFTGSPGGATGLLGPDGTPVDSGSQPIDYSRNVTESQNALDTIEENIQEAPGEVERLSMSVLLDADAVEAGDIGDWETALASAAGIDTTTRNDVLTVTRMPFDTTAREAAEEQLNGAAAEQSQTQLLDMIRYVVTLLIVGLVLFLAWRAIKRSEANRVPLRVPLDLRELEAADLVPEVAESRRPAVTAPVTPIEVQHLPVESEVANIIEQQPDEVAMTLRSWLADRRG